VRSHAGHEVMDGNALAEALGALENAYPDDPARSHCQASMEARVQHARAETAALLVQPQSSRAREQLDRLDQEFGGLLEERTSQALPPAITSPRPHAQTRPLPAESQGDLLLHLGWHGNRFLTAFGR
jgi:hypothetical protein